MTCGIARHSTAGTGFAKIASFHGRVALRRQVGPLGWSPFFLAVLTVLELEGVQLADL